MSVYLMVAIILANLIAIGIVYQFIKKLPKKEIILFLAVSVGIIYIAISIVYWMSGFGIEPKVHEETKSFVTYLFVPVNVILFIPYLASQYYKLRQDKIKKEQLQKKVIIIGILFVLVLGLEYFYFTKIQNNIAALNKENKDSQNQTVVIETKENTISNGKEQQANIEENNIIANEM